MENTSFEIAKGTLKAETGKDFVLIAWERK